MTTPICSICGNEDMFYIPCPDDKPECLVMHTRCPNGPEDSPYHKLFRELVAVRKIVFRYKHDNAALREQLEEARLKDEGDPK